jgi:hypothetical protein
MSGDVHKWLFDALGDEKAVTEAGDGGWLSGPQWGEAVERTRLTRYPTLTLEEGARQVGLDLGRAFLANDIGALVRETLPMLELERVAETLLPALMARLRRPFEVSWDPAPRGGLLRITGPMATRPGVTHGFFEAVLGIVPGKPVITLLTATPTLLEFRVERSVGV